MEGDAGYAFFYQDQQFRIAAHEQQREARDAVNQAVAESSESLEVTMMQELQGVQNRYEGRLEENERSVAPVIGSEAREAFRGQTNHVLHELQVLLGV